MPRTTSAAVRGVLGNDYNTIDNPSLTPYIDTAASVVGDVVACATRKGVTLAAAKLELIERWLAAHFYACSDQPYASKQTSRANARFQGETGMYLEGTKYGMAAVIADSSGCLAQLAQAGKRHSGSLRWLGKPPSSQIDVDQRD